MMNGKQMKPNYLHKREVVELRKASPCFTLQQIGDKVGVSRERARQILKEEHLATRHQPQMSNCVVCGRDYRKSKGRKTCGDGCRDTLRLSHWVPLVCSFCDNLFYRRVSDTLHYPGYKTHEKRYVFCNKICNGKWLAKNFGLKKGECHGGGSSKRKWDYDKVYALRDKGFTSARIARELGIPLGTIYSKRFLRRELDGNDNK